MGAFELDERAIEEIANQQVAAVRDVLNEVVATHKGQSEESVGQAIAAAAASRGLDFEPGDDMIQAISSGQDVIFR
jgi:hypothetical protein